MNQRMRRASASLVVLLGLCISFTTASKSAAAAILPAWSLAPSPVVTSLNSVDMVSAKNGWAVGGNGTLLHYDGTSWEQYASSPTTAGLFSISMSSAQNGWALDYSTLIRWNGTDWSDFPEPSPPYPFAMKDISAPNDSSAWVAGGIIVCSPESSEETGCIPEYMLGTIARWNGSAWQYESFPYMFFTSIFMLSDANGYAAGTELDGSLLKSVILHWDGETWSGMAHPMVDSPADQVYQNTLGEVTVLNEACAWVTVPGRSFVLGWNGYAWIQAAIPFDGAESVSAISPNNAWAVGAGGKIAHWDGASWALAASPVTADLASVAMVSFYDIWAVGESGTILHGYADPRLFNTIYLPGILR